MNLACLLLLVLAGCDTGSVTERPSGSVTVTPGNVTLHVTGDTISLIVTAVTGTGETITSSSLTWTSVDPGIATVSKTGLVTAAGLGTTLVIVSHGTVADTAAIRVEWDHVVANATIEGDVVVPDGKAWLIGPAVAIAGNLRTVGGTIGMRPGSSLKFLGANPDEYVGGGMSYGPDFARDIGLWVGAQGALDIRGTPKQSWNRSGTHETWAPDDEYWIAPTDVGDYAPRRWYPGDPIPRVPIPVELRDKVPWLPEDWRTLGIPTEVMNVTRDIVIEGPGHIHIHSTRPQVIEYVQLRRMGVSNRASKGPVLGRYALHLHQSGDGARGTILQGVAAINSEGTVFVPHASHGITMIDNVSVNSFGDGFWWDKSDETNDILVDRLCVSGARMPKELGGGAVVAINNHVGRGNVMRNSAASGANGGKLATGFFWVAGVSTPAVWEFDEGNVAHNNTGDGVRFWTNSRKNHRVENTLLYRNKGGGIQTGAYRNAVRYADVLLVENGLNQHASSKTHELDGGPGRYERVHIHAREGPAIWTKGRNQEPELHWEFIDCTVIPGPGAPKVSVEHGVHPWLALFRRCGVVPDDIVFDLTSDGVEGSHVIIEHEDGRRWEITVRDGQKVVQQTH